MRGGPFRDGKLVVVEDEAEQVRLIFRRYLEVSGINELVRDLKERDVPNQGPLTRLRLGALPLLCLATRATWGSQDGRTWIGLTRPCSRNRTSHRLGSRGPPCRARHADRLSGLRSSKQQTEIPSLLASRSREHNW